MPRAFSSTILPILGVGLGPDVDELLEVVVHALDRVLVDEPFRRDGRLVRADRQHPERDGVVDQHVVPGRRIVIEHQRADALGGDGVGEVSSDRRHAAQRVADGVPDERACASCGTGPRGRSGSARAAPPARIAPRAPASRGPCRRSGCRSPSGLRRRSCRARDGWPSNGSIRGCSPRRASSCPAR